MFFIMLTALIALAACGRQTSQEVIQYKSTKNISPNFTNGFQDVRKQLFNGNNQTIDEFLQEILLSETTPPDSTLKAFSQLFAQIYINTLESRQSEIENAYYANTLGIILGYLTGLRENIIEQRSHRLFAKWYDYSKFDKRWLKLFTDIVPLALSEKFTEQALKTTRPNNIQKLVNSVMQGEFAKQSDEDIIKNIIYQIEDAVHAKLNGYEQTTGRRIGNDFDTGFSRMYRRYSRRYSLKF